MASEDIGLADPRALRLALDAAEIYERLGSPEGELALAQAVVYLAMAPKTNAVYTRLERGARLRRGRRHPAGAAAPAQCADAADEELDYGNGYRYAHDEAGGFAAGESYWPDGLAPPRFYEPAPRGLEIRIGERLAELRARNEAAGRGE